jgi:hypothetical protein
MASRLHTDMSDLDAQFDEGRTDRQKWNGQDSESFDANAATPPLTLAEWLARDLPEPDRLLGDLFSTT